PWCSASVAARPPPCKRLSPRLPRDRCRRNPNRASIGTFNAEAERRMLHRNRSQQGFTIVELMVALAILSILLYIAVPSFRDTGLPSQLRAVANGMVAATQIARSEAIKRNATVRLCVSSDGATCATGNWQQGWIVISGTTVLHS